MGSRRELVFACCLALFVTFVLMTNTVGVKLFVVAGLTLPVSILWYPLTFLVTDLVSELYGPRRATFMVVAGFGTSLILLGFALVGIAMPVSPIYAADDAYVQIFGPIWRLLCGSMAAYLLAQLIDVRLFHFWKRLTRGRHLWLRNNGSTMISQFVDSATVNFIFLYDNPAVFDGSVADIWGIVFAVYLVKIAIAALDTPLFYLGVAWLERYLGD